MSNRRKRVGVFGGTFDPIHLAHLRCAEEAREHLDLDTVLFVPASDPPHKRGRPITPAAHRLAMVRRAITGHRPFRASTIEIDRRGRSYTIDTLHTLRQSAPAQELVLLMGSDTFREIATWKDYRALFGLVDIAVFSRPNHELRRPRALLPVADRKHFCYAHDRGSLVHSSGKRVHFLTVTALEISATDIRRRLRRGRSVRFLLPPAVESYLQREQLYTGRTTGR